MRARDAVLGAAMLTAGSVGFAVSGGAPAASADPVTVNIGFSGAPVNWTVPSGVTSLDVILCGAQGRANHVGNVLSHAGRGARVSSTLSVSPGETLVVVVGGQGVDDTGGYNGGGDAGSPDDSGGGGATDIRRGGSALADRVLVAGGGGGAGLSDNDPDDGGDAGLVGYDGRVAPLGGSGGGASAGGAGGVGFGTGEPGVLGQGGDGGPNGGGGGGGGYYGGGGGALDSNVNSDDAGGGGGGSSLVGSGLGSSAMTGFCHDDGFVDLHYVPIAPSTGSTGERYTGVAPCRIVDTRVAGGPLATVRHFDVSGNLSAQGGANTCGVPDNATSIAVNLTAISTGQGFLRGWASGTTPPTATLLNYGSAINMSNMVNIPLCRGGGCADAFDLKNFGASVHVVADVVGYYRSPMFATVNLDGSLDDSSGSIGSARPSTGRYTIDFDRNVASCITTVTGTDTPDPHTFSVTPATGSSHIVRVNVKDMAGVLTNSPFQVQLTC